LGCEFSTGGGPPTGSLILLHGIACPSSAYTDGDMPLFGMRQSQVYAFKPFIGDDLHGDPPRMRCVLPSSPKTKALAMLEALKMFPPDPDDRTAKRGSQGGGCSDDRFGTLDGY
jgi:hypothetical protein